MLKKHLFRVIVIGVAVVILSAFIIAQENVAPDNQETYDDMRQSLIGAWAYAGTPESQGAEFNEASLKFWGEKHWCICDSDPNTGLVIYHHGGTYTLDGNNYEETLTFATENTQHLIGITLKYKIKVDGDTFIQEGIGNRYTQKWKRMKAE